MLALLAVRPLAAAADDGPWGAVLLPGGAIAARQTLQLGASDGRFDATWIVDFVRRNGRDGNWSDALADLRQYLAIISDFEAPSMRPPDGWRLPPDKQKGKPLARFRAAIGALGLLARLDWEHHLRVVPDPTPEGRKRNALARVVGLDPDGLVQRWNDHQAAPIPAIPAPTPLPLPLPRYWTPSAADPPALSQVLRDRSSALLYVGLMSLDDETLTWLDGHRAVVDRLRDHAAAFATFGRSLRIAGGRVAVPGGDAAAPAWSRLVGASPANPGAFLAALLSSDGGDLADFYDAVGAASPGTRGAILERAAARPSALDDIYQPFRRATVTWSIDSRPFDRPLEDPALALALVDARDPIFTAVPALAVIMDRASDDQTWPDAADRLPKRLPAADIEWLTHWLFDRPAGILARARLLRTVGRLSDLDRAAPADLEFAARTCRDLPTLALALVRVGVRSPADVARVGRAAYALGRAGDRRRVEPLLARWQASLALVEQVVRVRRVPQADINRLVLALADAASQPLPLVTDALTRWATDVALPALAGAPDRVPLDPAAFAAIIGRGAPASSNAPIVWDTLAYDRNPVRLAGRDLDRLLSAGGLVGRADIAAVARLQDRMTPVDGAPPVPRQLAVDLEQVTAAAGSPSHRRDPHDAMVESAIAALRGRSKGDARVIAEVADLVGWADDLVVQPIVYGVALTPLHQSATLLAEAWSFHRLAPDSASGDDWWRRAWQRAIPEERAGGGTTMVGSWLLLDLALGDAIVPRRFDRSDALAPPVRDAILADIAARARGRDDAAVPSDLLAALARGRARLAGWRGAPLDRAPVRAALEAAGVGAVRVNAALWTLAHQPDALASGLSVFEIAGLGGGANAPVFLQTAIDGCPCAAAAPSWPSDALGAYWQIGVPAVFAIDLPLALADRIAAAKLPPVLAADILPLAASDWLAHADPYGKDDWTALMSWPGQLTSAQVDGYLLQLVSEGILVPVDEVVP